MSKDKGSFLEISYQSNNQLLSLFFLLYPNKWLNKSENERKDRRSPETIGRKSSDKAIGHSYNQYIDNKRDQSECQPIQWCCEEF